MRIYYIIYLVL